MAARPTIAIVGGGYAGMAAALTLTEAGLPPTVFEAGHRLGGRARALPLESRGQRLDNGQHLLLGAYHATLNMATRLHDTPPWLRLPFDWHLRDRLHLCLPRLPAPLHSAVGLLTARGLSFSERLATLRLLLGWQQNGFRLAQDQTVAMLLAGQSPALTEGLWRPLCLAALNTPIETASAQVFLNVLQASLAGSARDSDFILPTTDLAALLPQPVATRVLAAGGEVHTGHRIRTIQPLQEGFLVDNRHFDHVICATAPWHVAALFAPHTALQPMLETVRRLPHAPIATIWLQYPAEVRLPRPINGLSGTVAQWLFDRGASHGQHGLIAAVVSIPPHDCQAMPLAAAVAAELQHAFGLPPPLWTRAVIERRATFSCEAGLIRPGRKTPLPGLYLAGDYTEGPYPATLEAAVQSGVQCADDILSTA